MSFDSLSDLNWLEVLAAAVAYFIVGAVWYLPATFGKPWMRSIGWEPDPAERPNPAIYMAPLLTSIVSAVSLGMLAAATGTDTASEGVALGLVVGIGLAGSVLLVTALFDPKKPQQGVWFVITAGYHLVGILLASVIIATMG
jgi:hypothetical protein